MAVATGHATTIAFTVNNWTYPVRSITGHTESGPQIDSSDLSTVGARSYIPHDLDDLDPFDVELLMELTETAPETKTTGVVTITYKISVAGNAVNATLSGSAHIASRTYPSIVTNELMTFPVTIQWQAKPTFTIEAVA